MPSSLESASTRKTGMSARRTNPIALGIVQTLRGAPASVWGGGAYDRSTPIRR